MSLTNRKIEVPPWFIFHVPHDSTTIPPEVMDQFIVTKEELDQQILALTDHHTLELFTQAIKDPKVVRAPVSRLVVDVERFDSDVQEPMASRGMGAIYQSTSDLTPLRKTLTAQQRQRIMNTWYYPHHQKLEAAVLKSLYTYGKCFIVDCHSFPSKQLPYEVVNPSLGRPEICVGTDSYHTPAPVVSSLIDSFQSVPWSVMINHPFSGSLVPIRWYTSDKRVSSCMIEVRRDLYMDEKTGQKGEGFFKVSHRIGSCLVQLSKDCIAHQDSSIGK
jgi:N-formylglutamate deformylase